MIRKKWKIETLLTLLIFLLLLYNLSHLMKNRRCKGLRQKQEIEKAPKENISFEENLMFERSNHVKKVCKEIRATSNDFCSFKSKYHEYDQAIWETGKSKSLCRRISRSQASYSGPPFNILCLFLSTTIKCCVLRCE